MLLIFPCTCLPNNITGQVTVQRNWNGMLPITGAVNLLFQWEKLHVTLIHLQYIVKTKVEFSFHYSDQPP